MAVEAADDETAMVRVTFMVRETSGDLDVLGEPLADAVGVPPGPLTKLPLMNASAPAEAVACSDGVADFVAVADELALLVALAVAELVRDGFVLGETAPLVVPPVPSTTSEPLKKSRPADAVARGDALAVRVDVALDVAVALALAVSDLLAFIVRETNDDRDTLGEPLDDAERVPPLRTLPLTTYGAPGVPVSTGEALADRVDVRVELALPVAVLVAVRVRFGEALPIGEVDTRGDRDTLKEPLDEAVSVPAVPLNSMPFNMNGAPELAVAVG